jgi:hypothetical protein
MYCVNLQTIESTTLIHGEEVIDNSDRRLIKIWPINMSEFRAEITLSNLKKTSELT